MVHMHNASPALSSPRLNTTATYRCPTMLSLSNKAALIMEISSITSTAQLDQFFAPKALSSTSSTSFSTGCAEYAWVARYIISSISRKHSRHWTAAATMGRYKFRHVCVTTRQRASHLDQAFNVRSQTCWQPGRTAFHVDVNLPYLQMWGEKCQRRLQQRNHSNMATPGPGTTHWQS